jgi:hypothetical protein
MPSRRTDRLRRTSRVLKFAAAGSAVLIGALYAGAAFDALAARAADTPAADVAVPFALGLLPLAAALSAIVAAARLFARFESGRTLDPASARLVGMIGRAVVAAAVLGVVARSLAGAWASSRAGEGALAVTIGTGDLAALGAGLLVVVLGWALGEAAAVAEENRRFV